MATANDVLRVARGEIGYSRWDDPAKGTKYGRWYAQVMKSPYFEGNGVPYCAMFVSWVFAQVGATAAGLPGAYCPTMLTAGRQKGRAIPARSAQPGDLVYFDWDEDIVTDHVGIVEKNNGAYLTTIEGNTSVGTSGSQDNGGRVARRARAFSAVVGVIRPSWDGTVTKATTKAESPVNLAVDGIIGRLTVAELQAQLGTPKDGVISGQSAGNRRFLPSLAAVEYTEGGSLAVAALQAKLGVAADGYLGPVTVKALQRRLKVEADGYLGPVTARALQTALNDGAVRTW